MYNNTEEVMNDNFIIDCPPGHNLSLLNTIYHYPQKIDGKWTGGAIDLIIKDNVSNDKFLHTIENPKYEYYMLNGNIETPTYSLEYADINDCKRIIVPFNQLQKDIMERLGMIDTFYNNCKSGNRQANKTICNTNPAVLLSDMDIEDNVRFQFSNIYENGYTKPTKSYLDIEADTINCKGDFVELGECPINAVSFIDDKTLVIHSFLLRNPDNPLIDEFEKNTKTPTLTLQLKQFLIDAVGGPEQAKRYKIDKMTCEFHFYDEEDEIIMLKHLFNYINNLKPDLVLAWNMAFDIPYIIQRIIELGYNPKDILCSPDFRYKECSYFIDERNQFNYEERNDFAKISSYSVYTDQMIHFASRRKGQAAIASYKLDYIGQMVCGVKKLDYSHITKKVAELPYKDYKTFVFYNIMDTIVHYCIETKVNDLDSAYNNVLVNNTRWSKVYRQTVYLKNRAAKSYYNYGLICGNNVNQNTPKVSFPGAFVASPLLNSDYSKMEIKCNEINSGISKNNNTNEGIENGTSIFLPVYDNLQDQDFTALYPSIASEDNMSRTTLIGHINIPDKVYEYENRFHRDEIKWRREAQFTDELQSHCWLDFFNHWFHFASYEEMYDDIVEYYSTVRHPDGLLTYHDFDNVQINKDMKKDPFVFCRTDRDKEIMWAMFHRDTTKFEQPKFDFDKSDFNSFTEIFDSLKDGYTYSKPKHIATSI